MKEGLFITLKFMFITVVFLGCKEKDTSTQFFWRKDLRKEQSNIVSDYIIISNAPNDSATLKLLIDNFNDTTDVESCMVEDKKYIRSFYKESKQTPRDFEEYDDVLGGHIINDNFKDYIFEYSWEKVYASEGVDTMLIYFYYYDRK